MANIVLSGLAALGQRARARLLNQTQQADRVQTQFLRSLLKRHQDTAFGRQYHLGDIQTIDQFRQRLPLAPYTSFEPYIERMVAGEPDVLTAEPPVFFNLTSGSTGKKKLIPVTKQSRRAIARANQAAIGFLAEALRRRGQSFGKMLYTNSAVPFGTTASGVPYGPVSTSDLRLANFIYRQVFAFPFEALQIPDGQTRTYVCLLFALQQRQLGSISATFPILALSLAQTLEAKGDRLVHDLAQEAIAPDLKLNLALRQRLQRQWNPAPRRAAELQQSLKQGSALTPALAWPELRFMVTARGGTSNFYFEQFPAHFGGTPIFGGTYASAEATFGVHRDFGTDSVLPALESGFFEFIPEDQWEVDQPKTRLPWEVTVGDRYRIVVTNYSGFYRYDLGDVVEIEGFCNLAPRFIFRHRRGGVISASTEKTTEFHVTQTMQRLQQEFGVQLNNFCITLSEDIPPHYWVNVEPVAGQAVADPARFLQRFDEVLKEVHVSYAFKRGAKLVPPPQLRILAAGGFEQLRQRMIAQGRSPGQIKFPLVTDDRHWVAGLPVEQEVSLPVAF
ncbi:MAG: GH3 auxin-responsive promoter family protein [Elainellaceae cyanobacterium]